MKIQVNKNEFKDVVRSILKEEVGRTMKNSSSLATNRKEDVMERFYGIQSNGHKPMLIEKITVDRIMQKHGDNGFVIISANRSDRPQEENDVNTKRLVNDIKSTVFSYLPTYGGYRGTDGVEDDYEPSFLVFNYDNEGNPQDFEELREFAIEMCGKYNQDSVLIKDPNNPPIYVDRNGNKANARESNEYWKNDPTRQFFTSLKPKDGTTTRRVSMDIDFDESVQRGIYINPHPCTLNERRRRKNEIFLY